MAEKKQEQLPSPLPKLMSEKEKNNYLQNFEFPFTKGFEAYEKILKIGQGTFGEVWKAKNIKTDELVAMKKILTENEHQGFPITALRELKILKSVSNEHIVALKEVVTAQGDYEKNIEPSHYLVFEFCKYDLAGLLSISTLSFSLAEIKSLTKQLLLGLHYLHKNNMLHRDIKPSNVLVSKEGVIKIADFGLSRTFSTTRAQALTNRVVTLWYRPPELLLGDHFYTTKIDIWGAGCIMAEMWTRQPILQGSSEQRQLSLISAFCGSINTNVWPDVKKLQLYGKIHLEQGLPRKVISQLKPYVKEPMACDLLDKLLILDPTKRLDTDSALDHDLFFANPMPADAADLKETFEKIGADKFEYFTSRRQANIDSQATVPPAAQPPPSQQTNSQQRQRPKDMFESHYCDQVY